MLVLHFVVGQGAPHLGGPGDMGMVALLGVLDHGVVPVGITLAPPDLLQVAKEGAQ